MWGGVACSRIFACAKWLVFLCVVAPSLSGCFSSITDGPPRVFTLEEETTGLHAQFLLPDFQTYSALSDVDKLEYRNELVTARMYAIDLQYTAYEVALTKTKEDLDFAADTANIGLTSTATLLVPSLTKNVLTATASGLTGIKGKYDADILLSKTIQILINQMRADRALVAATLLTRIKQSPSTYTLAMALSDLEDYYRAGTMSSALVGASQTTSKAASDAKDAKDAVTLVTAIADDAARTQLLAYIYPNGLNQPVDKTHRDNISRLNTTGYPLGVVMNVPTYTAQRAQLLAAAKRAGYIH